MTTMITKTLDDKGRVTLGARYARQTVFIDDSNPDCIKITPVVMIPAGEAWLYKNKKAIELVRQGLEDATKKNFAEEVPDIASDLDWLDDVED